MSHLDIEVGQFTTRLRSLDANSLAAIEDGTTLGYLEREAIRVTIHTAIRQARLSVKDGAAILAMIAPTTEDQNGGWAGFVSLSQRLAMLSMIDVIASR